jgi:hypothetical protein
MVLFLWGALSDEKTGVSFVYVAGPCQCSLSQVWVPWDSWPYFTVSDLRLPFSSPPTTRRVMVEVFEPASTLSCQCRAEQSRAVAYCLQPASTVTLGIEPRWDPWSYICSVSRFLFLFFFFHCSSFDKREGLDFFYNWCSLATPYSTRGHIKVGDIYILYIFTKHKLTLSSIIYSDICQCRIAQQLMPQLI